MAWYHTYASKILAKFPWLYERLTLLFAGSIPASVPESPWTSFNADPFEATLMFVTTGGVHTTGQEPFDMDDQRGDTSYRWIPKDLEEYTITHDYYDHSDADEDLNCLYPLELATHLSEEDLIGPQVDEHLSFMGHIEDPLVPELMDESLPGMWEELEETPDLVLLSPG